MAYRFGRSNWQNTDRLNLLKVYQENATWDDRLKAMREIYAPLKYPLGYFTENVCREEVERILSEPTPNLRINVSPTFVYSRKIMIEKWIEYFQAEADKSQMKNNEISLVNTRSNNTVIGEVVKGATSDRLEEIMTMIRANPERNPNDGNYKRMFGALYAAILDHMENGKAIDLDALNIPATNPAEDFVHSDNGYIPDVGEKYDFTFFTPRIEMLTLAEVAQVAVPAIANTMAEPKAPVDNAFPDDLLESGTTDSSPIKKTEKEEVEVKQDEEEVAEEMEEMEVDAEDEAAPSPQNVPDSESPLPEKPAPKEESPSSDDTVSKKSVVTQSTKPQSSTQVKSTRAQQKKKDTVPSPIDVKDLKEEEQSAPPSPATTEQIPSTSGNPRSRGRPRHQSNSSSSATPTTSKKADRETSPEEDSSESVPVKKPRHDRSQEPSTSSSTRNSRNVPNTPLYLKPKEGTPLSTVSSTVSRSESGFDLQGDSQTCEVETQTYITVRHRIERRSTVPPSTKRGRKSQAAKERSALVRPNSGSSSSSKPSTGSISPKPHTFRTFATNTGNVTVTHEEQMLHDDEQTRNYLASFDNNDRNLGPMNMDTIKEIEQENAVAAVAAAAAALEDPEREAYPPPATGFCTLIVQADPSVAKALIEKKGFTLANSEDYIPAADSPIKPRRSNVPKNDQTRQNLLVMLRAIHNCQWGDPFKRPVPTTEELYSSGIFERIDLSGIKKEIEHGNIRDPIRCLHRLYRMCSNAIMFNGYDHDVHLAALYITNQVLMDLLAKTQDEEILPAQRTRAKDKTEKERGRGMERESEEPPTPSRSSSIDTELDPTNSSTPESERRVVTRRNQNNEGTPTTEANGRRKKRV
ncbi:unnamed protein product [Caenorhabditis brenneri]